MEPQIIDRIMPNGARQVRVYGPYSHAVRLAGEAVVDDMRAAGLAIAVFPMRQTRERGGVTGYCLNVVGKA